MSLSLTMPPTPRSTLFPYTTLFRSHDWFVATSEERVHSRLADRRMEHEHIAAVPRLVFGKIAHAPDKRRIEEARVDIDRKSTRLNSSHPSISYAVFCLKKKNYITDS